MQNNLKERNFNMKQIKEVLDKNKSLKMFKQSQGKKAWIPAILDEDDIIITERKAIVGRRARLYKDLYAISTEVAETNYNLGTQNKKEPPGSIL